ncbi:hypothetical protein C8R46DRAFT_1035857 [Mycena filopes]|nr:hypothetical protein C8R46DRAFT_1035857 [Mycena filopes]
MPLYCSVEVTSLFLTSLRHSHNDVLVLGDDQVVRLWDIEAGECLQELRDSRWGQITALSWLGERLGTPPTLFVGTGRGVVSTYPFSNNRMQRARQVSTAVFMLDDSVEVQAVDPQRLRFAVASQAGQIRMFSIANPKILIPLWSFRVDDIPRDIAFQTEYIVVHTCCKADVTMKLHGSIGSAAFTADGSTKAVYNWASGTFDVYRPADSLVPTMALSIPEGSDIGTVHIFQLDGVSQRGCLLAHGTVLNYPYSYKQLAGADCFYPIAFSWHHKQASSTADYHFIAAGGTTQSAAIFIWRKATEKHLGERRRLKKLQAQEEKLAVKREMDILNKRLGQMQEMLDVTHNQRNRAWLQTKIVILIGFLVLVLSY